MKTLSEETDLVPSGTITFYDSSRAPLPASTYTLTVTQDIDLGPEQDNPPPYVATQTLQVTAPRFSIQPQDVQSVFPPGNQSGSFAEVLPHAVLTRDLPWARPIVPNDPQDSTPWLAILVVWGSESGNLTGPTTRTVQDLVDDSNNTIVPDLPGLTPDELSSTCQLLNVNWTYFQSIAPKLSELPYLTHVRSVDTANKVTGLANGFWSVVVANRLPASSGTGILPSTAYLVSLEGHSQHLNGSTASGTSINLAVLATWSFSVSAFPGDFLSLLQSIKANGQNQVLRMLSTAPTGPTNATVQEALDLGFFPAQAELLEGEQSTVWFRGPLTAWPSREDPLSTTYTISDHAIRYDPDTGLFDFSYVAAWQIGRLLALADPTYVTAVQAWRKEVSRFLQAKVQDAIIRDRHQLDGGDVDQAMAQRSHNRAARLLNEGLGELVRRGGIPQVRRRRSRIGSRSAAGLPSREEVQEAVRDGQDPLELVLQLLGHIE